MTLTSETRAPVGAREAKPVQIAGEHYWITRKRLHGVVICKWCGLARSPAAKARRCEPLLPASLESQNEGAAV